MSNDVLVLLYISDCKTRNTSLCAELMGFEKAFSSKLFSINQMLTHPSKTQRECEKPQKPT